ncbi:TrkH family potassium uptake protein [Exiguobacterium flavidum]|uniref:TrkH family potassium uptake protein n=1 Tax=Exiguobacterium flavidum TaxID=2184695 RepID=UPI000DF7B5F0|nr:TrkH family potassium uptake protein [Exiguobacterium flavidum]
MDYALQHRIQHFIRRLTPIQSLVILYSVAVVIGVILLGLPWSVKEGYEWEFTDLVFMAVSCVSVTGLTTVPVADTFTTFGYFMIMLLVQVSGIGLMSLHIGMWVLLGKRIGFRERQLVVRDQNQTTMQGVVKYIREVILIILAIEAVGAIILGLYYTKYFPTVGEAMLQGLFGSVSATTNAGFDITGESLLPFRGDLFVVFMQIVLLTLGAIGFPVLVEVRRYISYHLTRQATKQPYHFSLFTKLTASTFFILILIGTVFLMLFEWNNAFKGLPIGEQLVDALFQSVTTRNGGLTTVDITTFSQASIFLLSLLMFIGASPSSVGGGIRTTTFAVAVLSVVAFIRGELGIKVFGREIGLSDIWKAFVVIVVSVAVTFVGVVILLVAEDAPFLTLFFEACSAFGTTGLSLGITSELSNVSKWTLIVLMFIGRIGVISFVLLLKANQPKRNYNYPKESVIIG